MEYRMAYEVFSPSGYPRNSYVQRKDYAQRLVSYLEQPHGVVVSVSGPSQAGKTVLVNYCIEMAQDRIGNVLMINGGGIKTIDNFWTRVVVEINERLRITGVKVEAFGIGLEIDQETDSSSDNEIRARTYLRQHEVVLIIDDFHQIPVDTRSNIILELKGLIETRPTSNRRASKAIIIFVPTREMRSANLWADMQAGRVRSLHIPLWNRVELQRIAAIQFVDKTQTAVLKLRQLAQQCFGLPSIMQAYCLEYCNQWLERQVPVNKMINIDPARLASVFEAVGNEIWRVSHEHIYNELTTGSAVLQDQTINLNFLPFLNRANAGNINQMIWYAIAARKFALLDQDDLFIEDQVDIHVSTVIRRLYELVNMTEISPDKVIECITHMSDDAHYKYTQQLEKAQKPRDPVFEYDVATSIIRIYSPAFLVALRFSEQHRRRFQRTM